MRYAETKRAALEGGGASVALGCESYDDECEYSECDDCAAYWTEIDCTMGAPVQFELVATLNPYRRMIVDLFLQGPPGNCQPGLN